MKNRNPYTKKAARLALAYNHAQYHTLAEAYPSGCSNEKRRSEARILEEMLYTLDGRGFRITSKNTFRFSCAYTYTNNEGEIMLRTHTANTYHDTPYMFDAEALEILNA